MPNVLARIERIRQVCASPSGYAQRGLASWEVDQILEWAAMGGDVDYDDEEKLRAIERRVFAPGEPRG